MNPSHIVLRLDGTVEWINEAEFKKLLKKQQKEAEIKALLEKDIDKPDSQFDFE